MNKILIVEDDKGISNSLKLYLENTGLEVELYYTGKNAVEKILNGNYDAIILDINLPDTDGIEICRQVREKSNIAILMLTARTSELDKIKGLEIGADDYIEKPFSPRELLARIKVVLRRSQKENNQDKQENSNIIEIGNIKIDKNKKIVFLENFEISFTKNEYDIFLKIVEANGTIVSRETLMTEVIGYEQYVYDRTLDTHIKNIRKKISIGDKNKDLILTVRGEGYRLNK